MQDRPDLPELLEAVRRCLGDELAPALEDPRLRFRALIAQNLLAIAGRELELQAPLRAAEVARLAALLPEAPREPAALRAALAQAIRAGAIACRPGDAAWAALRQSVIDKLRVANPGFLERHS